MDFTFQLIEEITKKFSEELKIGSGGYGDVYKAEHDGKDIAVKKLFHLQGLDDKEFKNESLNLMRVQHQNIVKLVGYCYETRNRHVEHNGELVFARITERVLCLEYLHGGSLASYISDESCGLDWTARYKIIKGTCEGLHYLHNGLNYLRNGQKDHIYHLDLKPDNILLDRNMTPKIADFGLSRLFNSSKTHITETIKGTRPYMPPEFIDNRKINKKYDVFSLGVIIIQIMAGHKGYDNCCEMSSSQEFVELVHDNWNKRLQAMPRYTSHDIDILGVKRCLEIALRCVETDPVKRPTILEIVDELSKLDAEIEKMSTNEPKSLKGQKSSDSKDLGVDPALELRFPFEVKRDISCCLQLTNKTDHFVAFYTKTNEKKYCAQPNKGTMPPWSKCYIVITMQAQEKAPPNMQCHDMFFVQSTRVSEDLASDDITEDLFKRMTGKEVDEEKLPIVYVALPQPPR